MADASVNFKKSLLKKEKKELVKILKSKNQPTNGNKSDLVDRILAYDEKNGGKMARKESKANDEPPPDYDEELAEGDQASSPMRKKSKPKSKPQPRRNNDDGPGRRGGGGGGGGAAFGGGYVDCEPGFIGVAQMATAVSAVGQVVLGILQFILLAETMNDETGNGIYTICNDDIDTYECIGPSLFWDRPNYDGHGDMNASWRASM